MIKLKNLQLKNYRGFLNASLDFTDHITCIAGINGSGKTTILGAIEKSMLIFLNVNNLGRYLKPKYALNATDVHFDKETTFLEQKETAYTKLLFSINDVDNVIEHSFEKMGRSGFYNPSNFNGNDFKDARNCPIFAFYSINRRNVSARKRKTFIYDGFDYIFSAWENVNLVNFDCFFDWYKNELLDEYQAKEENPSYINKELLTVRNAISSFFGDSVKLKIVKDQLIAIKDGVELLFSNISDGEKSITLLLADIARRLAIANPNLDNPLEGTGIVLIDEIEMHLHPSWQRKVCHALKETFPNCQFIITTHSPQVLGELQPQEIRLLNNFEISIPSQSFGLDSNSILDSIQNTTNETLRQNSEVAKRIEEINNLIDGEKLHEAREKLSELEKDLNGSTVDTVALGTELSILGA
ncbi:MAG: AAA family ATPase [Treponema sp.]|nr:AAA family ATPase [Treponema sp.]